MEKIKRKTWLITGTSTGIGRIVAEKLLSEGYFVAGTARNIDQIKELENCYPSQFLAIQADVNQKSENLKTVESTFKRFGRIDVLLNNAGYGLIGTAEELTMDQIQHQMQTNFFGLVDLTKLVLPIMREQREGYIINVSSIGGLRGMAGSSIYSASKFAVGGFSEGLVQEVAPFGIKVSLVEPGPYRTDWAGRSMKKAEIMEQNMDSPYYDLNKKINNLFNTVSGNQPGKPEQIASVLMHACEAEKVPLHMIFGDEAINMWGEYAEKLKDESFMKLYPHIKYDL